jgi:hypothetical protein
MHARIILLLIALLLALPLAFLLQHRNLPRESTMHTSPIAARTPITASESPTQNPQRTGVTLDVTHDHPNYSHDIPAIASYEDLVYSQGDLLDDALARVHPRTPGRINLYALGFAGDGEENVFRNEVDYFARLVANRLGADGHVLELINSPRTLGNTPLATRTNLYAALDGIAKKMDRDEDILLLFLTSHGSQDHELAVQLGALPLDQITPDDLRGALDGAKIRWRVIVVSACYSGGFVPALREPHTLIITAARSDRSSFGCGSDSKITYFGRAFLADALNTTTDFRGAYERARTDIAGWERRDREVPSEPQLWEGPDIEAKLASWRTTLPSAPPVPFAPGVVAGSPPRHAMR